MTEERAAYLKSLTVEQQLQMIRQYADENNLTLEDILLMWDSVEAEMKHEN